MKLYLAGTPGNGTVGADRENMLYEKGANRLFSYFWFGEDKEFNVHFNSWIEHSKNVCLSVVENESPKRSS